MVVLSAMAMFPYSLPRSKSSGADAGMTGSAYTTTSGGIAHFQICAAVLLQFRYQTNGRLSVPNRPRCRSGIYISITSLAAALDSDVQV